MKKILTTWYGISDLRASIGIGHSNGPILSALLAENYDLVSILGYTDPIKTNQASKAQEVLLSLEQGTLKTQDYDNIRSSIELLCNTEQAHDHFLGWLNDKLALAGKRIDIRFRAVRLKHLNDTEGIYDAAITQLNDIKTLAGEKLVTLFLSPGTPVMAFVWAFVALRYPNLKKRLIASPVSSKVPESVILPLEWLEWHGRQVRSIENNSGEFDVILHLFGEQRMPSLLGIKQFSCQRHVFVRSVLYPSTVMKQFLSTSEYGEVIVDPYDPEKVRSAILDYIETDSSDLRIGFNLTGGTKLMYAGALAACRKINATPLYFNSFSNKMIYLNDFNTEEIKPIRSVDTFIQLNGESLYISKPGYSSNLLEQFTDDRKNLTQNLWEVRHKISKLYSVLSKYLDSFVPFNASKGGISVSLTQDKTAEIRIGQNHYLFQNWPDFARYLAGGWFEEYTCAKLSPLLESGLIFDLRIGLEISCSEISQNTNSMCQSKYHSVDQQTTYQELDISFTDGRRLYIVECKAGRVTSEHIMKLQNIVRFFGGIEGRAILAACFDVNNSVVKNRVLNSRNMNLVYGISYISRIEEIIKGGDTKNAK